MEKTQVRQASKHWEHTGLRALSLRRLLVFEHGQRGQHVETQPQLLALGQAPPGHTSDIGLHLQPNSIQGQPDDRNPHNADGTPAPADVSSRLVRMGIHILDGALW